jgi:hypothetical protein
VSSGAVSGGECGARLGSLGAGSSDRRSLHSPSLRPIQLLATATLSYSCACAPIVSLSAGCNHNYYEFKLGFVFFSSLPLRGLFLRCDSFERSLGLGDEKRDIFSAEDQCFFVSGEKSGWDVVEKVMLGGSFFR